MNELEFIEALKKQNIHLNDHQLKQFDTYFKMLVEWNEKMNLTNITEKKDVYLKHFYDSITPAFSFNFENQTIADIGAGAGFPSIPLKICFPNLNITIVDSLNKRIIFLNELFKALELKDCQAISARAEEHALSHREHYDIVCARAVARFNILDELCLPLVKVNGHFIALKGSIGDEEYQEAKAGIHKLGGQLDHVDDFELSAESGKRMNFFIKKVKPTPTKYPRPYAKIKKNPLS